MLDSHNDVLAYHSHVKRVGSALERSGNVPKRGPTALERRQEGRRALLSRCNVSLYELNFRVERSFASD